MKKLRSLERDRQHEQTAWSHKKYTFRLDLPPGSKFVDQAIDVSGWFRSFEVSEKTSLEQLSSIIQSILGWNEDRLYCFEIANNTYIHFGPLIFNVSAPDNYFSSSVPLYRLNLDQCRSFLYQFDLGERHTFRLHLVSVSEIAPPTDLPALIEWSGENLIQYPHHVDGASKVAMKTREPRVRHPGRVTNLWKIRFIRTEDKATLTTWREAKNKLLWQKAVAILESEHLSAEEISRKVDRPLQKIQAWIAAYNHRGINGLLPHRQPRSPDRRAGPIKLRNQRVLEILHDRPKAYGINRASWTRKALVQAYLKSHAEKISLIDLSGSHDPERLGSQARQLFAEAPRRPGHGIQVYLLDF